MNVWAAKVKCACAWAHCTTHKPTDRNTNQRRCFNHVTIISLALASAWFIMWYLSGVSCFRAGERSGLRDEPMQIVQSCGGFCWQAEVWKPALVNADKSEPQQAEIIYYIMLTQLNYIQYRPVQKREEKQRIPWPTLPCFIYRSLK